MTPTNSSLHYCRHVLSQLRRHCLRRKKVITCWDDDYEEHGNKIEAGRQLRLLLPHDLLSSLCKSNLDRPIAHSDLFFLCSLSLFFVVRSFLCSSSSNRWFFRSVLPLFFRSVIHRWFFFGSSDLQVPKSSLRDQVLLFRT